MKKMVCSVKKYSDHQKTGNVIAENTKESDIKALFATVVVWRLRRKRYGANAWGTLNWWYPWCIYGILKACPTRLATYWV